MVEEWTYLIFECNHEVASLKQSTTEDRFPVGKMTLPRGRRKKGHIFFLEATVTSLLGAAM